MHAVKAYGEFILNLATKCWHMGGSPQYRLTRRLIGFQRRSRRFGEEKHLLLRTGIEPHDSFFLHINFCLAIAFTRQP